MLVDNIKIVGFAFGTSPALMDNFFIHIFAVISKGFSFAVNTLIRVSSFVSLPAQRISFKNIMHKRNGNSSHSSGNSGNIQNTNNQVNHSGISLFGRDNNKLYTKTNNLSRGKKI
jgi:hypothetical protein